MVEMLPYLQLTAAAIGVRIDTIGPELTAQPLHGLGKRMGLFR